LASLWECGLVTDVGLAAIAAHLPDLHSLVSFSISFSFLSFLSWHILMN
jgi:hypothetical protein